jgi:Branched-chain amino acid ABC-type transport system, permease components
MDYFLQLVLNGLFVGAFYALVALGYTMVYGIIKLLNFAHGDIYSGGGFVASPCSRPRPEPWAPRAGCSCSSPSWCSRCSPPARSA